MTRRGFALIVGSVLALVLAAIGVDAAFGARVHPGVRAAGIDLGGLVETDVRARLDAAALAFAATPVTVVGHAARWTATNAELGLRLDTERVVAKVLAGQEERGRRRAAGRARDGRLQTDGHRLAAPVGERCAGSLRRGHRTRGRPRRRRCRRPDHDGRCRAYSHYAPVWGGPG